jgi:hypothetical protein
VASAAGLIWGWVAPDSRDPARGLAARICLPISAAAALALLGAAWPTTLRHAGGWMALVLMGQAAARPLIQVGPGGEVARPPHLAPLAARW